MAVHAQTNYILTTKPAKTSLLGGHFIYRVDTTQGTLTPSSANITENAVDNPQQWGYNTHIGANGIKLRHNEITLSEWKADHLTFYKPGTNNPSLELISGVNTALNIYNPTNNTKTLGLDTSGLNFYGTSTSAPDVTLNADGLTLINGSIRGGIVGQDEFLYLSPQVFADEYEEYILSEDTEVDETKTYYIRSGEEGVYIYTEVSEPTGNPQENEYYEIAHAPGTIPIDNYVKNNWRQIIGRKFAVDTDGNLYANGLNANNANIEGNITATSLRISSGSDVYDGAAAINISGYDIEIEKNGKDEVEGVSVYLYPILYHNGVQVPTVEVDYSHFIWYQDDDTIGTEGDGENSGRYLATYGHNYRVVYDFDDGAVGGGTEVVDRTIDPSKYITKISDTGITIHPEVWSNQSSYIQLDGTGMELFNSNGQSIAKYGNTIKVGLNESSRFLINSNSLEAYDNNNDKYFEVTSNRLKWGNNIAATTSDIITTAETITHSYITDINDSGIFISPINQTPETGLEGNSIKINGDGMEIFKNNISIAAYGDMARIGKYNNAHTLFTDSGMQIWNGEETNVSNQVAIFGASVRIGGENANRIEFSSDRIKLISYTNVSALDISTPTDGAISIQRKSETSSGGEYTNINGYNLRYCTDKITITSTTEVSSESKTIIDNTLQSILSNLENGSIFTICMAAPLSINNGGRFDGAVEAYANFTKASSGIQTQTITWNQYTRLSNYYLSSKIIIEYNAASNVFTLTYSSKKTASADTLTYIAYAYIDSIEYEERTLESYAYLNGNVLINSFEQDGESQVSSGDVGFFGDNILMHVEEESNMYYLLENLNDTDDGSWWDQLCVNLSITNGMVKITSISIPLNDEEQDIYALHIPKTAEIFWESSDVQIAEIKWDADLYDTATIICKSKGTCTITATMSVLKRKYTASLIVTIT
jgi:hypothetical protein